MFLLVSNGALLFEYEMLALPLCPDCNSTVSYFLMMGFFSALVYTKGVSFTTGSLLGVLRKILTCFHFRVWVLAPTNSLLINMYAPVVRYQSDSRVGAPLLSCLYVHFFVNLNLRPDSDTTRTSSLPSRFWPKIQHHPRLISLLVVRFFTIVMASPQPRHGELRLRRSNKNRSH